MFSWRTVTDVTPHRQAQPACFDVSSYTYPPLTNRQHSGPGTELQRFPPSFRSSGMVPACAYPVVVESSYVDYCTGSSQNLRQNKPLLATQLLWLSLQRTALTALLQLQDCRTTSPKFKWKPQNMSKMKSVLPSILGKHTKFLTIHIPTQNDYFDEWDFCTGLHF